MTQQALVSGHMFTGIFSHLRENYTPLNSVTLSLMPVYFIKKE
jgi:hypothetical protein